MCFHILPTCEIIATYIEHAAMLQADDADKRRAGEGVLTIHDR